MRLSDQVREEAARGKLLPTPEARHGVAGADFARSDRPGAGSDDLVTVAARLVLLPTIMANEAEKATNRQNAEQRARTGQVFLTNVVQSIHQATTGRDPFPHAQDAERGVAKVLPTPRTADAKTYGASATARARVESGIANLGETVAVAVADVEWGEYEPAVRRWEKVMGPAPSPTEPTSKGTARLSARFTEWMMGQPAGWITSPEIGLSRNEQLKACGNGVVTQQAAAALADMLRAA
ncbi:DNA methyltransferase [Arthrobacter phage Abidatro]|uniref:DNA methyltransferase n=1 Tax=Arthrobacter phage Abidatro TaxID=2015853 RepID=A0A222ZG92_9CAUD|nr:DNA methyltransferase [Arthrobacter phage Abidatro]ASR83211.1 DNA methyltransferase [Arthrobacter phage Abidatro]